MVEKWQENNEWECKYDRCCDILSNINSILERDEKKKNGQQRISQNRRDSLLFQKKYLENNIIPSIVNFLY